MRRRNALMALAGALGGLIATLPTLTAAATTSPLPASATVSVSDFEFQGTAGSTVNIAPGGTVTFSYQNGSTEHNVDFGTGPQPSFCTVGSSSTQVSPPVPSVPTASNWTATCTFTSDGTYSFHCDKHTFMTGTVYVGPQTTTTTSTQPTTSTPTPTSTGSTTATMTMPMTMPMPMSTTTTGTSTTAAQPALLGGVRGGVLLGSSKGGAQIHGTLKVALAGKGGHALISVVAPQSALGAGHHAKNLVVLGQLRINNLRAGPVSFNVALKRSARSALLARSRLTVTVRIVVSAAGARTVTITRTLRLRA